IESPRCPKALGTRLATHLAGTAARSCRWSQTAAIQSSWLAAGPRRIAGKLASTACGQNLDPSLITVDIPTYAGLR
ncbi:MAG TPA: hypothetical protein VN798_03780, partial [Pseudomonas sp.]|nr:hypothetical protein [Pseudomonas sp.]